MSKLIDYEGLETFHTNLLNDNATSELATWSSQKINTSKQNRLTAGNNISISGDTISADGYLFNPSSGSFATIYRDEFGGSYNLIANVAMSNGAHAEGARTSASSNYSHAEGLNTTASGEGAHAEGKNTKAESGNAHAEGESTVASGSGSHAEGYATLAQNKTEHAEGSHNISHKTQNSNFGNAGNTIHSIGIGYFDKTQSQIVKRNAVEVMQNADVYIKGVGNYDGVHIKNEQGAPANLQTLQEVISSLTSRIAALEARIAALENPTTVE